MIYYLVIIINIVLLISRRGVIVCGRRLRGKMSTKELHQVLCAHIKCGQVYCVCTQYSFTIKSLERWKFILFRSSYCAGLSLLVSC